MQNIVGWLDRRRLAPETKDVSLKYIADFESSVVLIPQSHANDWYKCTKCAFKPED